jgi:L-threonylcarbamoyladenylate synthase
LEEIEPIKAPSAIKQGNLLLAMTACGWSLLCDARNEEGLNMLRTLKNRSAEKGFTVLVESDARLNRCVEEVPALAWDIFDTSEEPLTLVLPKGKGVSKACLASDGSIAVRMVKEASEVELVRMVNGPVAGTALLTASGEVARSPEAGDPAVLSEVDYLINLPVPSSLPLGKKPPIVRLELDGEVKIIRA